MKALFAVAGVLLLPLGGLVAVDALITAAGEGLGSVLAMNRLVSAACLTASGGILLGMFVILGAIAETEKTQQHTWALLIDVLRKLEEKSR